MTIEVIEWGLRIDCPKNGCAEPHSDNGEVAPRGTGEKPRTERLNGHAVTVVSRTVTYGDWS